MADTEFAFGWVRDTPDFRDHLFMAPEPIVGALPSSYSLRASFPDPYNQGQVGSCTGNAVAGIVQYQRTKKVGAAKSWVPSRLFLYYNGRALEGTTKADAGASLRDVIKCLVNQGVCPETNWPYNTAKVFTKPGATPYKVAMKYQAVSYQSVPQDLTQMKACIAGGNPIVLGISVYESFMSPQVAQTGVVSLPSPTERLLGGHAVLVVGYDDATQTFQMRNSWGTGWGDHGYFTIPYSYLTNPNLCADLWTVITLEA